MEYYELLTDLSNYLLIERGGNKINVIGLLSIVE